MNMPDEQKQLEPLSAEAQQMELLAQPDAEPERQYCVFRAGRERFCFSVLDVEEVVEWPPLTRVPLAPSFLMGIFNLRGSIVPVVDIAFSEGRRPDLPPRHVVVASLPAEGDRDYLRIGIAADEVIGTYSTAEPLLVDEAPRDVPHCCGMLHHQGRLALALDLKKLTETFPIGVI
jgi:purine-binding chemotaxis protein CheW